MVNSAHSIKALNRMIDESTISAAVLIVLTDKGHFLNVVTGPNKGAAIRLSSKDITALTDVGVQVVTL